MRTVVALCNDEVAVYREDEGAFRCCVNWDGFPVLIRIACDPFNVKGIERAKAVFKELWDNQEYYEEVWENEYYSKLLPILTRPNKYLEEVLEKEELQGYFKLSEVTIIEDMPNREIQASYIRIPEKIDQIEICVSGTLENGFHTLYVEGDLIALEDGDG